MYIERAEQRAMDLRVENTKLKEELVQVRKELVEALFNKNKIG